MPCFLHFIEIIEKLWSSDHLESVLLSNDLTSSLASSEGCMADRREQRLHHTAEIVLYLVLWPLGSFVENVPRFASCCKHHFLRVYAFLAARALGFVHIKYSALSSPGHV